MNSDRIFFSGLWRLEMPTSSLSLTESFRFFFFFFFFALGHLYQFLLFNLNLRWCLLVWNIYYALPASYLCILFQVFGSFKPNGWKMMKKLLSSSFFFLSEWIETCTWRNEVTRVWVTAASRVLLQTPFSCHRLPISSAGKCFAEGNNRKVLTVAASMPTIRPASLPFRIFIVTDKTHYAPCA